MAAKSKSITNPIPWSLLLKPLAVSAAWLFLPWGIFLAVALCVYFLPFFRILPLLPAFLVFVFMTFWAQPNLLLAMYAGVVMALILWVKDLVIVGRKTAYQLLIYLISFAACLLFFGKFATWSSPGVFSALAILSALWIWILNSHPNRRKDFFIASIIAGLMLFEIGAIILFLPISFFTQAILLFFGSVLLLEIVTSFDFITARQMLAWFSGYAAIFLSTLFLGSWNI